MSTPAVEAAIKAIEASGSKAPDSRWNDNELVVLREFESALRELDARIVQAENFVNEARLTGLKILEELRVRREIREDRLGLSARCEQCQQRFVPDSNQDALCLNCEPAEEEKDPHEDGVPA